MGEKAAKVENFGTYLSEVVQHSQDRSLLQLAAQVMGHLVRSNVQLTAALVDSEVIVKLHTCTAPVPARMQLLVDAQRWREAKATTDAQACVRCR